MNKSIITYTLGLGLGLASSSWAFAAQPLLTPINCNLYCNKPMCA